MRNCGSKVVAALEAVPGVTSVDLDFPAKTATVAGSAAAASLASAVSQAGFTAAVLAPASASTPTPPRDATMVLAVGGLSWCVNARAACAVLGYPATVMHGHAALPHACRVVEANPLCVWY